MPNKMKSKLIKYIAQLKKRAEEKRDEAAFEKSAGCSNYADELILIAEELEKVIRELEALIT
jgi:hypothetical protein